MSPQGERRVDDLNVRATWWREFEDRAPDDRSTGPARRLEVAMRCRSCWGQSEAWIDADELCSELCCRVCGQRLDGQPAGEEWQRMTRAADRHLPGARVGRPQAYADQAKFVLKLLPEMDRDRVKFEARVEQATDKAKRERREREPRNVTRLDFEEPGTPGFLFLQACAFVAGLNAARRGISLAALPGALQEQLGDGVLQRTMTPAGQLEISLAEPVPARAQEETLRRMGSVLTAGFSAAFACEVGLKAILLTRTDEALKSHDLSNLFEDLPDDCQKRLRGDFAGLDDIFRRHGRAFGAWRYFEPNAGPEAFRGLVDLERARALERAARVIIDEGAIAGLQHDLDRDWRMLAQPSVGPDQDGRKAVNWDGPCSSIHLAGQFGGHETAIDWETILALDPPISKQADRTT